MTKSLADRIHKAGLKPWEVSISHETQMRLIFNRRGLESLKDFRDAVLKKSTKPGQAARIAKFGIERAKEVTAKWKASGGYLP